MGLPYLPGGPISISSKPQLTAYRGGLLSGEPERGTAVYAASFVRERRIVLEAELFRRPQLFRLILVHEIFHFVWPRLSNELRSSYGSLLEREVRAGARGELGESSQVGKGRIGLNAGCWKEYVCESFCDTAAWLYSGVHSDEEFRLADRWKRLRSQWFHDMFERYWKMRCL